MTLNNKSTSSKTKKKKVGVARRVYRFFKNLTTKKQGRETPEAEYGKGNAVNQTYEPDRQKKKRRVYCGCKIYRYERHKNSQCLI